MVRESCQVCRWPLFVPDETRKRFDGFVCSRCHQSAREQIVAGMPAAANAFMPEEANINGRRCAVLPRSGA
jgi:hypothetical protein